MIVKGIISAIYVEEEKLSVILPEYDNMVTAPLKIYGSNPDMTSFAINDFVMVVVFNSDFNDGMVLAESHTSGGTSDIDVPYSLEVDEEGNLWLVYEEGATVPSFIYDSETGNLYYEI